jgi:hypothetical protein
VVDANVGVGSGRVSIISFFCFCLPSQIISGVCNSGVCNNEREEIMESKKEQSGSNSSFGAVAAAFTVIGAAIGAVTYHFLKKEPMQHTSDSRYWNLFEGNVKDFRESAYKLHT